MNFQIPYLLAALRKGQGTEKKVVYLQSNSAGKDETLFFVAWS